MALWWVFHMEDEMKTCWKCGRTLDVYEEEDGLCFSCVHEDEYKDLEETW